MVDINTKPASELTKEETAARAGVDVSRVQGELGSYVIGPEATSTPQNFQVNDQTYTQPAIPNDDILSDASGPRSDIESLGNDINKGLAEFGIKPPEDTVSPVVADIIKGLKDRQADMDKRRVEDIKIIQEGFDVTKEEQKISQERVLAQAEGRTRIGGMITKMETDAIQDLQRKFRLDNLNIFNPSFIHIGLPIFESFNYISHNRTHCILWWFNTKLSQTFVNIITQTFYIRTRSACIAYNIIIRNSRLSIGLIVNLKVLRSRSCLWSYNITTKFALNSAYINSRSCG